MRFPVLACAGALLTGGLQAAVTLPNVFGDNMVLQRGLKGPVWGRADPGETVTVSFAGQCVSATAGADGTWRVFNVDHRVCAEPQDDVPAKWVDTTPRTIPPQSVVAFFIRRDAAPGTEGPGGPRQRLLGRREGPRLRLRRARISADAP